MQMLALAWMPSLIVAFTLSNLAPTHIGATAVAKNDPIDNCVAGQTTITSRVITAVFSEAKDENPPSTMVRVQQRCKHAGATHQILVHGVGSVASKNCKVGGYIWAAGTLTLWEPMPGATRIPLLKANGIRCGDSWQEVQ